MNDVFSKVLFVGPQNNYGGIGAVLRTYQKNLTHFNFIATHKDQSKIFNSFYFLYSLLRVNMYLLTNPKIQIVHLHSASKGSMIRKMIIAMLAKAYKKKVIFHMHGGQFKDYYKGLSWSKPVFTSILNKVDLFICLTEEWKTYFETVVGLKHTLVVANPIDIHPNVVLRPIFNELKLLFLGSINHKKGIFDLLDYLETNPYFQSEKIDLTIGGIGEVDRLLNKIHESSYKDQIHYVGYIDGHLKAATIEACDIFILPSYYEGLPVSILEALSHGKPIIATKVGGVASIVKVNQTGWLFEAGKFNQLDPILEQIMYHRFPLEQYQKNAINMASNFSTHHVLSKLTKEYQKLFN